MKKTELKEVVKKISEMEKRFDCLKEAFYIDRKDVLENPFYSDMLFSLTEYYESGQWLCHYELDEKGLLPKGIKRGVLSQDELFNFLEELAKYKTDM